MTITKPSKTYSFTPGTGIRSSQTNTNFDDVFDVFEEDAYLAKGWFAVDNASFEYNSANSIKTTSDVDVTGLIQVGDKITFEQATDGEKFFFITAIDYNSTVANRTYIELYGGTNYDVDNEAITADTVGFSRIANPYGYPAYFQGTKQRVQVLAGGQVQVFGWGAIDGAGAQRVTESVTFPITFSEAPYLAVGTYGRTASSPTNLTDITATMATTQGYVCYAYSVSSTGFTAAINNTDGSQTNLNSGTYYGYTYTVQGKL